MSTNAASHTPATTAVAPAPPVRARRAWWSLLLLVSGWLLLIAYGVSAGLWLTQIDSANPADWPRALLFDLAVDPSLSPWLEGASALLFVALLGVCLRATGGMLRPASAHRAAHGESKHSSTAPQPHVPPQRTVRVFVSHASGDNAFGQRLAEQLRAQGIDVWYDSRGGPDEAGAWQGGIGPATYWQDEIVRELSGRDIFLLILTPQAVASKWVRDEIALAWSEKNSADVTKGKIIVPVLRATCAVPPLVALVQYVDYRPDADQAQALRDVLVAVRMRETRPAPSQIELGPPFDLGLLPSLERFVGREDDVRRVMELLLGSGAGTTEATVADTGEASGQMAGIAAANGLAGIGKTALATEVVRRLAARNAFPDGVAVVVCKDLTDPIVVLRRVLARFTNGRREPEDETIAALSDRARVLLKDKHALVVLDNVEQDWPLREVLGPLRAAGAGVLLTSRAVLPAVGEEASVKLDVLPLLEALDVFAEYYGRGTASHFDPSELEAATAIVTALGRHTLAVKLAAANATILKRPLVRVAAEFKDSPQRALLLANGEEAVRYVLDSSYAALKLPAQQLFVTMGAFASADIGREAVLAVATTLRKANSQERADGDGQESEQSDDTDADVAEVDHSLLEIVTLRLADTALVETMPEASDRERVRLHPLVQTYVRALFARWSTSQQLATQHTIAAWYAEYTNTVDYLALTQDESNLMEALQWVRSQREADDLMLARLCNGMRNLWVRTGRTGVGLQYLPWGIAAAERVAARTGDRGDRLRQGALINDYAYLLKTVGRLDEAERLYQQAVEICRELGDQRNEGATFTNLGAVAQQRGQLDEAQRYYEQALAIDREVRSRADEAIDLNNLGSVAHDRGHLEEAQRYYEQALAIQREGHDLRGVAIDLNNLGLVARQRGQLDEAQRYYEQALAIQREVQDRHGEGVTLSNLGSVARQRGQLNEAQRYFEQALGIAREVQDRASEGIRLNNLGDVAQERGQFDEAQRYYEQALAIQREVQDRQDESATLSNLGDLAHERGQIDEAQRYYEQALAISREAQDRGGEGVTLGNLGILAQERGQLDDAQRYYEQALAIKREVQDRIGETVLLTRLGRVAESRGALATAEEYYQAALDIDIELEDSRAIVVDLQDLAHVADTRGDLQAAQEYRERAAALAPGEQSAP